VRRAERATWAAIEAYGTEPGTTRGEGGVNPLTAQYLNRLSDLLFILARVANLPRGGDVLWQPGGGRAEQPDG
jgi:cob(I)alamin adenosyltransferase